MQKNILFSSFLLVASSTLLVGTQLRRPAPLIALVSIVGAHTHFLLRPRSCSRRPLVGVHTGTLPLSCSQNTLVARHCLSAFPWRYIRAKVCALRRARSNETRRRRSNTLHETCSIYQRLRDAPAREYSARVYSRARYKDRKRGRGEARREREALGNEEQADDERDKGYKGAKDVHPENGNRRPIPCSWRLKLLAHSRPI